MTAKIIEFNVNDAMPTSQLACVSFECYINGEEIEFNPIYFSQNADTDKDNDTKIAEALDRLSYSLENYEERQDYYSDKDIDKALALYEDCLYEALEMWNDFDVKLAKIVNEELENLDIGEIDDCKFEYLGDGNCRLSSENIKSLSKGREVIGKPIGDTVRDAAYNFIEEEVDSIQNSIEMRLGEIGTFKIEIEGSNQMNSGNLQRSLIDQYDIKNCETTNYGSKDVMHMYKPNLSYIYHNGGRSVTRESGDLGGAGSISAKLYASLEKDESFGAQLDEIKEIIVNALENADGSDIYGYKSIVKRAREITRWDIEYGLRNNMDDIIHQFVAEHRAMHEKEFQKIDKLLDQYENTPKEILGENFIQQFKHGGKYFIWAIGWDDEQKDRLNSALTKILNETVAIYEGTKENMQGGIAYLPIDRALAGNLAYSLVRYSQSTRFNQVVRILDEALEKCPAIEVNTDILAELVHTNDEGTNIENCGKVF